MAVGGNSGLFKTRPAPEVRSSPSCIVVVITHRSLQTREEKRGMHGLHGVGQEPWKTKKVMRCDSRKT